MTIKARKLKELELPGKTELYEVTKSCDISVEEKQSDGSLDQVILEYRVEENCVGYFAKEYRPADVPKNGSKVIDITAVMLSKANKCVRWYLYDVKDTLGGENTVMKLYNQWNSGLRYLQQNILNHVQGYSVFPNLGVITRCYDEERMKRLRDEFQKRCDEIENYPRKMTLLQRKDRTMIGKYRANLKVTQAILDRKFEPENGTDTYIINIEQLLSENDRIYKMKFLV